MTPRTESDRWAAIPRRVIPLLTMALTALVSPLSAGDSMPATDSQVILTHRIHGSGPERVLLLHHWMGDATSYDNIRPYLDTDRFTFVFAELRGYGESKHVAGEFTVEEASADAMRLADHLGWDRFHVVGHSMSGMIVQRLAIDDWTSGRRRIKSVVAVTPVSADGYPADSETAEFMWNLIHDRDLTEAAIAALTGERLTATWNRFLATKHLRSSRPEAMRGYYRMWLEGDFSKEAQAAGMQTPMLLIGGRQDLPGFQEAHYRATFEAWYPNLRQKFIADAGHFPMYETPAYLASLIDGFLRENE